MGQAVMKAPMSGENIRELTKRLYTVFYTPQYILWKLTSVRSLTDLKFIWRGVRKVQGHLTDFT